MIIINSDFASNCSSSSGSIFLKIHNKCMLRTLKNKNSYTQMMNILVHFKQLKIEKVKK